MSFHFGVASGSSPEQGQGTESEFVTEADFEVSLQQIQLDEAKFRRDEAKISLEKAKADASKAQADASKAQADARKAQADADIAERARDAIFANGTSRTSSFFSSLALSSPSWSLQSRSSLALEGDGWLAWGTSFFARSGSCSVRIKKRESGQQPTLQQLSLDDSCQDLCSKQADGRRSTDSEAVPLLEKKESSADFTQKFVGCAAQDCDKLLKGELDGKTAIGASTLQRMFSDAHTHLKFAGQKPM
eukprot:CAMPEP_0202812316 /NCGR_PEP_ID=MMETSP1389-20130828/3992_1 /ASSEMBLY_ACC=CAM_ASM_000865 /TAXON_ID=302021 /ORGANISM="Rhodomonas sp., Strain CCMP768" /LENGTH=246 /DNA_ID=CAMNT_0049483683 /DNA_START=79 /DNA_END=820 /DNA_ORIENTATION=+